ncbi:aquaporin-like protein, partial [Xylona heveae TC161]
NFWSKIRYHLREPIAEWLGTSITVLVGTCGSLSVATSAGQAGSFLSMNWAWGFGVMLGIYIAGGVSGAHLNPAISIVLSIYRGFPAKRCLVYICAQLVGAITGAGIAFAVYKDAILHLDHALIPESTGIALYTQPKAWVSPVTGFFNEYVATAVLACAIFALGDDSNAPPGAGMHSFVIGLIVAVLCMTFGYNTGGCFNPARDFGPRLVALMGGYGRESFIAYRCWFLWGGWIATIAGAIAGGGLYDIVIFTGGESPINYP